MLTVENDARVFFARKGYYKGKEVTVTHHDGAMVWLEDYPVGGSPVEYGCWVPNDSIRYKGENYDDSDKRRSSKDAEKTGRRQNRTRRNREE